MDINILNAISPIDGRYRKSVNELEKYFSESALIKYRIITEVEYFIALCKLPISGLNNFNADNFNKLRSLYLNFSIEDAKKAKEIEAVTNHDVKAIEYLLKEKFDELEISEFKEFIHFGLTSQDINNTAFPLMVKDSVEEVLLTALDEIIDILTKKANEWKDISMLARTHGQPASPTKLGKEIFVFVERLINQRILLQEIPFSAKFGGATGNFNAHIVAFPDIDWIKFANDFVNNTLKLERLQLTTQIEHYDNLAALFDGLKRINNILIDFDRDIWTYISMDYFKQKIKEGEIGSSAMPHKVNPIDFENSEGNLGFANAIFEHLSSKLPISRLQRDLTDSTVIRNIGVPFGHTLIGFKSLLQGVNKLIVNEETIEKDLENNWAVVAEAIQSILRREGYPKPYEALKELTRKNTKINKEAIHNFIDTLSVTPDIKNELKQISPHNYTGLNF